MAMESDRLFQRVVYDGLWTLLSDVLAEHQRRIQDAWNLPDTYDYESPHLHERTHTVNVVIAVFNEAQQDICRACLQGWYSESETRMCYWTWIRHIEVCRNIANEPQHHGESDVQHEMRRRYWFLRAHLWVWLVRRMTPVYQASRQWRTSPPSPDATTAE